MLDSGVDRSPAHWPACNCGTHRLVLFRDKAHVGCLDAQRRIVRNHACGRRAHLAKCCANDAVVGNLWIQPVFDQQVALNAVHFYLHRSAFGGVVHCNRRCKRAACFASQLFNRSQRRTSRTTNIIHSCFQSIELFNNSERDNHVATDVGKQAGWVGN